MTFDIFHDAGLWPPTKNIRELREQMLPSLFLSNHPGFLVSWLSPLHTSSFWDAWLGCIYLQGSSYKAAQHKRVEITEICDTTDTQYVLNKLELWAQNNKMKFK